MSLLKRTLYKRDTIQNICLCATWLTLRNHTPAEADSRLVDQEKCSFQGNQSISTSKFSLKFLSSSWVQHILHLLSSFININGEYMF